MAQDVIKLDIVTPAGNAFSDTVSMVIIPATEGLMGILANHAPIMTTMELGAIKYTKEDKEHFIAVSGGFVEVKDNHIIILAKDALAAENIDVEKVERLLSITEESLATETDELEIQRAKEVIASAKNQLKVAANLK